MELLPLKKEIVGAFIKHNILVSRDVLSRLNEPGVAEEWSAALRQGKTPAQLLETPAETSLADNQPLAPTEQTTNDQPQTKVNLWHACIQEKRENPARTGRSSTRPEAGSGTSQKKLKRFWMPHLEKFLNRYI